MNRKYLILLLFTFVFMLFGCSPKCPQINSETCKEHCAICQEMTKEECLDKYPCDICEECNDPTKEECEELYPSEECKDPTKEECLDKYPCDICEECNDPTKEECDNLYPEVEKEPLKLGIDLIDNYKSMFANKRVGLITNPTGINSNYETTIDVLYRTVNLTALFAPEHGIRGDTQAGGTIGNEIDVKTNLPVYSLYGNTKKPTAQMLKDVDVLCFDIQDVGARFYTYIYTMAYAMEACAEYNKTFVVFDRPNPVGSMVDGNILDPKYSSFIGLYPIVQRHGMTVGELARYFNVEFNINCELKIVKMKNWDRNSYYDDTNLPWIAPSPNMPTVKTAVVYTATCIFEGTNLSEGRGTTTPFEVIGAPFINPFELADALNSLNLPGVHFRPAYFTPSFSKHANKQCGGVQVHVTNRDEFQSVFVGFAMFKTIKNMYKEFEITNGHLDKCTVNINTGCNYISKDIYTLEQLSEIIEKDVETFMKTRAKYLLY